MADERLRLVAEVTDQFTGPLGKLETALRRTGTSAKAVAGEMQKDFGAFHGVLGKSQAALQGMQAPLTALGAGSLAASLSLGSITAALRNFSSGTQQLSIMSRETGLAIDRLRAFGALGQQFGVSTETMGGGVRKFADEMSQMRKRYGDSYSALQAMNLGELVEKLVSAPNMKAALDTAMEALTKMGDPVTRRKVAEQLFGTDQIGAVAGEVGSRYRQMMDDIERRQGKTSEAQVQAAKRFEDSLSRLQQSMTGLRNEALSPLLVELKDLIERFQAPDAMKAFSDQLAEIGKFARTTKEEFEAIVRVWGQLKDYFGRGDQALNKEFVPLLGGSAPLSRPNLEGRQTSIQQQMKLLDQNPTAPDYARKRDRMTEELRRVGDELEKLRTQGGASVQQQSYGGVTGGLGGLIQKANFGGGGAGGSGGGGFAGVNNLGPPLSGSGYGAGDSNRPIMRGSTGSGRAPAMQDIPSGPLGRGPVIEANPGAYKDVLDHIARSEGTANRAGGGYNTSLGYGRYLPGGQEQNLTGKTLNEISALGNHMRRQPGNPNSSALGRYQIVGNTMRSLMRKMGLKGDELFDEKMQDRMGAELARQRGANSTGLGQEWASLRGPRLARAVELMRQVDPSASTMPGNRVADANQRDVPGSGDRSGDQMMRRLYGDEAPVAKAPPQEHRLSIDLQGFPPGTRARTSMGDLFRETTISKSRQMPVGERV
ncbi:hypothetical protein ACFZ8E_13145 [Methylobacterium sp. HMF5984]|uniref:hypothetical protein n=1 Tax=Methylobacterium sp. HMF5984 TaxID=3367370 RepID=UPI003851E187